MHAHKIIIFLKWFLRVVFVGSNETFSSYSVVESEREESHFMPLFRLLCA